MSYHILILEDNEYDAHLFEYELQRAGLECTSTRVQTRAAFRAELTNRCPDIILSDYAVPQFSGLEALSEVKALQCAAPFILVTGSQTEEVAVECMKQGAADYILKANLTRLPSAVINALKRSEAEKEKKEAFRALRASEAQLLQAQKLEAVGRLAGGIAHDFNNLLTAMTGYCQLGLRQVKEDDPLRHNFEEIRKATDRAATLTRQLLAFSRKQVMQLIVTDLNSVVANIERMLERMIGEDIEFRTYLKKDLGNVKADRGQLEQVIMNLVVNARDAMPDGGNLTIETANVYLDNSYSRHHPSVVPGYYVMLAVSDTGIGMDQETRQRVFEPFFTTKEAGKGTGLGLSTVYGIVRQSGGNVWVYSEVNRGTTFKIYLPRVNERADAYKHPARTPDLPRGTETILLVEDADFVRQLACEVLEASGYRVLEASDGEAAQLLCQQTSEPIHLLLTDVVMPKTSGRELALLLCSLRPDLKVLYMSGYTEDAIVNHGVLEAGINFIQKPFGPDALVLKVREVLDGE